MRPSDITDGIMDGMSALVLEMLEPSMRPSDITDGIREGAR